MGTMGIRGFHPFAGFVYFAGWLVIMLLGFRPEILAAGFLATILCALSLGQGKPLRRTMPWIVLALLVTTAVNPLVNRRGATIMAYFMDQPLTLESILYGLQTGLLIASAMAMFVSFNAVITADRWLYLFARISPKTALLLSLAMRFVPLLRRRLHDIAVVQRTRGIDVRRGNLLKRIRDGAVQLQILLTWSLEGAVQISDSMMARGYGMTRRRTHYAAHVFSRRDTIFMFVYLTVFGMLAWSWLQGWGRLELYPALQTAAWSATDVTTAVLFFLYGNLASLLEGWEWLWWRRSRAKTSVSDIRMLRT